MVDATVKERLEYLRGQIEAEQISYFELSELQGLAEYIDPFDVVLLQWAGVPEFPEDKGDTVYVLGLPYRYRFDAFGDVIE